MDKIHGMATIKRNGSNIVCDVAAKLKIGGTVNNVLMVGQKAHRSEKVIASEIEVKIPFTAEVDLIKEQSLSGVEIQFQSDNGTTYVVPDAAQTGELESAEDGMITLTYMGDPAVKA
jgi:hypothetical protein